MQLKQKSIVLSCTSAITIALTLISYLEGIKYKSYYDVTGVLTVCYGHTGNDITQNRIYTKQECDALLQKDFIKIQRQVDALVKVSLDNHTKASLYSFAYNVGILAFSYSTLLKKLNAGDQYGACEEMKRRIYAGGKVWKGLINRREMESALCHGNL
ncbi:lysozyme [Proteus vulgaris]|uniref:lysozyme n=1 Tax=Proteus TaxID=583 RepID=UPI000D69A170|nr:MULTISPECIES: lysozyme [Proteus]MDS0787375.1 lysozyme [Proteus vulgaris]